MPTAMSWGSSGPELRTIATQTRAWSSARRQAGISCGSLVWLCRPLGDERTSADMSQYVYVYVGRQADRNFKIGMDQRIWGWKQPSGPETTKATDWLADPQQPTYLVFVQGATRTP